MQGLNDAKLVLILKKKHPTFANRIEKILDMVVTDTQRAFILGRLISDNVMVSYEVMHYLKRKKVGKDGFMTLKLDMSRAYDRVEWTFLKAILLKNGFFKMVGISGSTVCFNSHLHYSSWSP